MSVTERDFHNFVLGDDVHKLAGGVIPDIAERLQFDLPEEPNVEALGRLVGEIGKNKVLRNNAEVQGVSLDEAVEFVERSGVQKQLARSLWTPEIELPSDPDALVITGGVLNWMRRTADLLVAERDRFGSNPTVYALAGSREMNSPTEIGSTFVTEYKHAFGAYPDEGDYMKLETIPPLAGSGYDTKFWSLDTQNGDEIARRFVSGEDFSNTAGGRGTMVAARVANAGVQLALQMRKAARERYPQFDLYSTRPQMFVLTDTFPLATNSDEIKNPAEFQSPFTALRQVALTAKLLAEAAIENERLNLGAL